MVKTFTPEKQRRAGLLRGVVAAAVVEGAVHGVPIHLRTSPRPLEGAGGVLLAGRGTGEDLRRAPLLGYSRRVPDARSQTWWEALNPSSV